MRTRLILALVGVVGGVLLVHDIPLSRYLEAVERDRLVTQLERDAFIIAGRVEEALEVGVSDAQAREIDSALGTYTFEEGVSVVVVGADAIAIFEPGREPGRDFSNRPEIATALSGVPATGERASATLGEDLFYVSVPVLTGESTVGAVRLSAPERVVSNEVKSKVRGLFVVAGLSLLIATLVAVTVAVTVTRPLERLRRRTSEFASGDLHVRADDVSGPPEIKELAGSFNAMAERIEGLVERQRAFAGDASHQMRTPLTALRLRLEQAAASVHDPEATQAQIDEAIAETDRLRRLVEGLLALTRAESATVENVSVDLAAVVHERADTWRPLADEGDVSVVVDTPREVIVRSIDGACEQIVDNLVDNALEVSPRGSTITLRVVPTDAGAELHVTDMGPGLSAEQHKFALERFWRAPDATAGGSGLGLAIVRQLAEAGNGSVELRDGPGGGLDVVVGFRLP